jgi:transcriptional regulator with XRE-family HTH domain
MSRDDTLSDLIRDAKLSQRSFALHLGIHESAVSFWVSGRSRPHGLRMDQVANVLGVSRRKLERALDETARRRE